MPRRRSSQVSAPRTRDRQPPDVVRSGLRHRSRGDARHDASRGCGWLRRQRRSDRRVRPARLGRRRPSRRQSPAVVADDAATVAEDGSTTIAVLANDDDPDGDTLTASVTSDPAHGTAVNGPAGVAYTPAPNFSGTDMFTYRADDGRGGTATATVSVTVDRDRIRLAHPTTTPTWRPAARWSSACSPTTPTPTVMP